MFNTLLGFAGPALRLAEKGVGAVAQLAERNPKGYSSAAIAGAGLFGVPPETVDKIGDVLIAVKTLFGF